MNDLRQKIYSFRGYILGVLAIILILTPPQTIENMVFFSKDFLFFLFSIFLFILGVILRIKSRQYIGEHSRRNFFEANELITSGPYAYLRHPLYLSNSLIAISFIFFHLGISALIIPFMIFVLTFEFFLCYSEDKFLEGLFKESWIEWKKRTPLIPFFHFRTNILSENFKKNEKRTFLKAFYADKSTWVCLLFYNFLLLLRKTYLL